MLGVLVICGMGRTVEAYPHIQRRDDGTGNLDEQVGISSFP